MIRRYVKNTFYFALTGGIALSLMKDNKIIDRSTNLIEKFSSRYVQNFDDSHPTEDEKTYLKSLVNFKNLCYRKFINSY